MRSFKVNLFFTIALIFLSSCSQANFSDQVTPESEILDTSENTSTYNINQVWAEIKGGLPKSPNGRNFIFERITTEQGLSNNTVRIITQDSYGYIWIGTDFGLNRFDGDEFIVYQHESGNEMSLSDNHVWSIIEDSRKNIWVGTDNGLNLLDRKQNIFSQFLHEESDPRSIASNRIRAIQEDSQGKIWIGTWGGGLDRYDPQSGEFEHFVHDDSNAATISDNFVRLIYEDSKGLLWVGTSNGLNQINPRSGENIIFQRDFANPLENQEYESEMRYRENFDYYLRADLSPWIHCHRIRSHNI